MTEPSADVIARIVQEMRAHRSWLLNRSIDQIDPETLKVWADALASLGAPPQQEK